jgi:transcriptional regulator of arginine metabolism
MHKTKRLLAIEKIIGEEDISSHEVLLKRLKGKGIICTQSTLSRNLRQLGAGRIPDGKGGYKYFLPEVLRNSQSASGRPDVLPVIRDLIEARGLIVIKTLPGNASSTASYIDNTSRYEIAGTIAGDDTLLIIPRDGVTNQQMHTCIEMILPGLHEQVRKK